MKTFAQQLKWQFLLLGKNNIISISLAITAIYAAVLYIFRDSRGLDKVLVALVLNDPSVIGYFFIALAVYTEMKHGILPAIFVSPLTVHNLILSKTVSIVIIGAVCSLGLAVSVRGLNFDILNYTIGVTGICAMSALLGLIMLTYADEFLKFAMFSIPVFLAFINIPLIQYLGIVNLGFVKYLFPIQGSLDLIDYAVSGTEISFVYSYLSIITVTLLIYGFAYRTFNQRVVHQ